MTRVDPAASISLEPFMVADRASERLAAATSMKAHFGAFKDFDNGFVGLC